MTGEDAAETKFRKFPKTIAVKWENRDDPPQAYMAAFDEAVDALEHGETIYIATYELKVVERGRLLPELK